MWKRGSVRKEENLHSANSVDSVNIILWQCICIWMVNDWSGTGLVIRYVWMTLVVRAFPGTRRTRTTCCCTARQKRRSVQTMWPCWTGNRQSLSGVSWSCSSSRMEWVGELLPQGFAEDAVLEFTSVATCFVGAQESPCVPHPTSQRFS